MTINWIMALPIAFLGGAISQAMDWTMSHPIAFTVIGYIFFSTVTCAALAQLNHRIDALHRRIDELDELSDQIYELVELRDRIDKLEGREPARANTSALEEPL